MGGFFHELKRRNVVRVGGAYAVVGWLLVQVATTLEESMNLPAWFDGLIVALLLIGLPIVLIFSWAFELTPDGVVRTEDVPESESITPQTGRKLDYVIVAGLVILIGMIAWQGANRPTVKDEVAPVESSPAVDSVPEEENGYLEKSIAVLPFANRSPNPEDAFFTEGIHDDLLTHLSKVGDLHVISRTSVLGYAGTERKIPDIGRDLGVATVMEGAVQRAGKRVRINVQLIDARTDAHLWAEIYDRELTAENVFDIQSEITKAIANALNAVLSSEEESELAKAPTQSLAAYDAYMTGQLNSGTSFRGEEEFRKAVASFDRAIELDTDFAAAYAGKAIALLGAHWYSALSGNWRERALEALEQAEALAPDSVETLTARGYYHYWGFLDYEAADIAFTRALDQAPNYIEAIGGKGFALRRDGRFNDALELLEQAHRLDPLDVGIAIEVADTHAGIGNFPRARKLADATLAHAPLENDDLTTLSQVYLRMGDIDNAWSVISRGEKYTSVLFPSAAVSLAIETRDPAKIREALENWPEELRRGGDAPEAYELFHARAKIFLGEHDQAQQILAGIKSRLDVAPDPYPQGWAHNAIYRPADLPGLMGDLEGVRAAAADFEVNAPRDEWALEIIYRDLAGAFIRAGDIDTGFEYITRFVDTFGPSVYQRLKLDVAFDPVREDARYLSLKSDYEAWAEQNVE